MAQQIFIDWILLCELYSPVEIRDDPTNLCPYYVPLKICVLKPNSQGDGSRRWDLWEAIRSLGWSPHEWVS